MRKESVQKLAHGLYLVFWNKAAGGGMSLCAVGSMYNGDRWIAACNWTADGTKRESPGSHRQREWRCVRKVQLIGSDPKQFEALHGYKNWLDKMLARSRIR